MALRTNLTQCWPLVSNSLAGSEAGSALSASFAGGGAAAAYVAGAPGPCWRFGTSSQLSLDGVAPPTQFALAVWWWSAGSLSNGGTLASLTLADSHYYQMMAEPAGFVIKARSRAGGAIADASDPGNAVSSGWNLSVMLVDLTSGSENIRIWQNGTMSAPTAITTVPAGSSNKLGFGVIRRDSDGGFLDGLYTKYLALWSGGLPTDADLDAWYANPASILPVIDPILSTPTHTLTAINRTTAGATIDSGGTTGTLYALARTGGSAALAATIKSSGQSNATTGTGAKTVPNTVLVAGTANQFVDLVYNDATNGDSNVVTVGPITTASALSFSGTVPTQTVTTGTIVDIDLSTFFSGTGFGALSYASIGTALTGTGLSLNTATGHITGTAGAVASVTGVQVLKSDSGSPASTAQTNTFNLIIAAVPTGSVTTIPLENLSGSLLVGVLCNYSWYPGGRIGSLTGITPQEGTATTHATTAVLTVTGLTTGAGVLLVCARSTTYDLDEISYHALTAA